MFNKLRNFKAKLGKWFWVLLVLVVVGVGIFLYKKNNKPEYQSSLIETGTVREELILTGSINAVKYVNLFFPTSGKIAWVGAKEGQIVKRGFPITSLNKTVLNSAYQQALNNYRNYQAAADQTLDSVKGHAGDETFAIKAERTAAEVARDNSYDSLKAAEYNLANATIYAPFDGVISSLPFSSPGVNVSPADVQVVMVDPSTIYFDVDADQNDVTSLKMNQEVLIVLDSFVDKEFKGKVTFISLTPKAGTAGTNYKVKVEFDTPTQISESVRIGMTGDAKFILTQKDSTLFVGSEFVKSDTKGKFLRLNTPENKVYIKTGLEGEERVEIIGDFSEGDIVFD